MLAVIDDFLVWPEETRKIYQVLRRMARITSPKEMSRIPETELLQMKKLIASIPDPDEWERKMNELLCAYI